jgi:hypothetical protein
MLDADRPENSEAKITFCFELFRPPTRYIPAPATEEASQNLELTTFNADPLEASK